jgi:transposase
MAPPDDHDCAWKEYAAKLEKQLAEVIENQRRQQEQLGAVQRKLFGKKSEKMPPMDREVRRDRETDPEQRLLKRRANAELRATKVEAEIVNVAVPPDACSCPRCGGVASKDLGSTKPSSIIEYVPGYLRRRTFLRQTLACTCGEYVVTAPVPDKVFDKTQYGPGFMAHLIVAKCCDSIPFYRMEKQFKRLGVPMARSTMTSLFHRAGELLEPLAARLLTHIAQSDIVLADETTERMQESGGKRAYIWTFIANNLIAYRFSPSRSGKTPADVLGRTRGTLVVDMYTGYNAVTGVDGRERAGCLAHVRRKFFDALPTTPDAQIPLDILRDIYVLEHDARSSGITGTDEHAELRWRRTLPLLDKLYIWLAAQRELHPPKSKMGVAIRYTMNNWQSLTRFIRDVRIPPDNNRSEAALRVVALGRKNFLFVGHEAAGHNLATLYTLVATCEANGVDPLAYLTEVLTRLDDTTASELDSLLPQNWRPAA